MMFNAALYLPWCRYLAAQEEVEPQLYADNRKWSLGTLTYSCVLLGLPLAMSGW